MSLMEGWQKNTHVADDVLWLFTELSDHAKFHRVFYDSRANSEEAWAVNTDFIALLTQHEISSG